MVADWQSGLYALFSTCVISNQHVEQCLYGVTNTQQCSRLPSITPTDPYIAEDTKRVTFALLDSPETVTLTREQMFHAVHGDKSDHFWTSLAGREFPWTLCIL